MAFNDDLLKSPLLRQRLDTECESTDWWIAYARSSGMVMTEPRNSLTLLPDDHQRMFALDMAFALNKHLRHDGVWIVAFVKPRTPKVAIVKEAEYAEWLFLWLDADGDPQFTIENDEPFWIAMAAGPDHWIEAAEDAWSKWKLHMRDVLDPKADQLFKRAQGQAAPSTRH